MRFILLLGLFVLVCASSCLARDLLLGDTNNMRLAWYENCEYYGIPFKKRVKEVFFSDPSQQIIRGIIARDKMNSDASPTITAGGIGSSFVNLRFKSERGDGLNYRIEIYV